MDLSHPAGIAATIRGSGTIDHLEVNDHGVLWGDAIVTGTVTATISAPGRAPETVTDTSTDSQHVLGAFLFDYAVSTGMFSATQAKAFYSYETAGNEVVLRFGSDEMVRDFFLAPGVYMNGTSTFSATLSTPYNDGQPAKTQTFMSYLPNNVFTGWSGSDTVLYVNTGRVDADLQRGTGINRLGTDQFIGIENLVGSSGHDLLAGDDGNNVFFGSDGDDTIIGRGGVDVAVYDRDAAPFVNRRGDVIEVIDNGVDRLTGIERLRFTDASVAFDLGPGEAAGMAVRLIGAAFDTPHLTRELVGEGLALFDAGFGMLQVCELALRTPLFQSLANSRSNVDFVNTVYRNVAGSLPPSAECDSLVGLLQGSGGNMTQAELLMLAASIPQNEANIDIVGLQQTGVEFV
jgi:hypothetical protein